MMKTAYIDCTDYGRTVLEESSILKQMPGLILHVGDPDESMLKSLLTDAVGIINGHTYMDARVLSQCAALKTIVFLGTGASSYIDLATAANQGIEVRTIRGYGDRTIAEHTFALMLSASRNIASMDRIIRRGKWQTSIGVELSGKRLGIVGVGGVGCELAQIAHHFGMEVVAWNRSAIAPDIPCKQMELNEVLATSNVVSLHLALNDTTRGIIGRAELALMREDAILVNAGRGALVDETELINALVAKKIAHAALDVFEYEPLPPGHALAALENVTLTAHAAFSSKEAMRRLLSQGFETLKDSLSQCSIK